MSSQGPAMMPAPQVKFLESGKVMLLSGAGLSFAAQGGSVVCEYPFVDSKAKMMGVELSFPEHYYNTEGGERKLRIFDHYEFTGTRPANFSPNQPYNFDVCVWPGSGELRVIACYRLDESEDEEYCRVDVGAVPSEGKVTLGGAGVYKRGSACVVSVELQKGYRLKYWQSSNGGTSYAESFSFIVDGDILWVAYLQKIKRTKLVVHNPKDRNLVVADEAKGGNIMRDE